MSLASRLAGRALRLPPRETPVDVQRGLRIPLPDGTEQVADRYAPTGPQGSTAPILLARLPYARGGPTGVLFRAMAERGYQVVVVNVRGTFGSTGDFRPFFAEREDGAAVLEWLSRQPWFVPKVGLVGASYYGMTQWAVARDAPEWVRCMTPGNTCSWFRDLVYPDDVLALETLLTWVHGLEHQEKGTLAALRAGVRAARDVARGASTSPVGAADVAVTGSVHPAFQEWLRHERRDDPYWAPLDFGDAVDTAPPTAQVAGWYDLFLKHQLDDHKRLVAAGRRARLVVGDHWHGSPSALGLLLRESLDWQDEHLRGRPSAAADVRVLVMGEDRWRDLPSWPPPSTPLALHLHAGGRLAQDVPGDDAPDAYRYDPSDPTPSVGGAGLSRASGRKDQAAREARDDVLCFTTAPLEDDLTVIGEVECVLHVRSSLAHTDVVVRLCEVVPDGTSYNVSDGIVRLPAAAAEEQPDGTHRVRITLFPTAITFRRGHSVRLQVSSGAHPLYARNPGTGEPLATATTLVAADQQVLHDVAHPSVLTLPVVTGQTTP